MTRITRALLLFILFCNTSFAQNIVDLDQNSYRNLGKDISFFSDQSNKLTLNDVLNLPDSAFKLGQREIINGDVKGNTYWLKIKYNHTNSNSPYLILDYGNIDYIDIYYKDLLNNFQQITSGNFRSFKSRAFVSSEFVFQLPPVYGETKELILRLKAKNTLIAAVKLVDGNVLNKALITKYTWQISFIGLVFALVIFHLFMFIYTRNNLFALYLIRLFFLFYIYVLAYLNGFSNFLGEEGSRFILIHAQGFAAVGFIATIIFNISFLQLKIHYPKILKWFYFLIFLWILIFIASIWDTRHYTNKFAQILLFITSLSILFSSLKSFYTKSFRKKLPFFILYVLGCLPICVVTIYVILALINVFPLEDYSLRLLSVAGIIEGVLITLAILGDKIHLLQIDKKNAEDRNIRLVRNRNVFLEQKIADRTEELIKVNDELKESNAFKDKLFSIIAHDMRSPLSSLAMVLQLAEKNMIDTQSLASMLSNIRKNTEQVQNIMDNLLNWSIAQMNLQHYNPEKINISEFLKEQLSLYENLATVKNIDAHVSCDVNLNVSADKNQLSLIIRNLIDNAIKFTPQKGIIEVGIKKVLDKHILYVSNSGLPITDETIFNILGDKGIVKSSAGTNMEKGTGLGLRLCIEYIKNFHSELKIENCTDVNNPCTVFSFEIPINND